jgi:hypothetical protein
MSLFRRAAQRPRRRFPAFIVLSAVVLVSTAAYGMFLNGNLLT